MHVNWNIIHIALLHCLEYHMMSLPLCLPWLVIRVAYSAPCNESLNLFEYSEPINMVTFITRQKALEDLRIIIIHVLLHSYA